MLVAMILQYLLRIVYKMKNINTTALFFVFGFCATMFVAFYVLPTPSIATNQKAKEKTFKPDNQTESIYLVVFTEQGRVETLFTERESAEKFIKKTDNESIYEVRVINYIKAGE
jgi:hypothetical protein